MEIFCFFIRCMSKTLINKQFASFDLACNGRCRSRSYDLIMICTDDQYRTHDFMQLLMGIVPDAGRCLYEKAFKAFRFSGFSKERIKQPVSFQVFF